MNKEELFFGKLKGAYTHVTLRSDELPESGFTIVFDGEKWQAKEIRNGEIIF